MFDYRPINYHQFHCLDGRAKITVPYTNLMSFVHWIWYSIYYEIIDSTKLLHDLHSFTSKHMNMCRCQWDLCVRKSNLIHTWFQVVRGMAVNSDMRTHTQFAEAEESYHDWRATATDIFTGFLKMRLSHRQPKIYLLLTNQNYRLKTETLLEGWHVRRTVSTKFIAQQPKSYGTKKKIIMELNEVEQLFVVVAGSNAEAIVGFVDVSKLVPGS